MLEFFTPMSQLLAPPPTSFIACTHAHARIHMHMYICHVYQHICTARATCFAGRHSAKKRKSSHTLYQACLYVRMRAFARSPVCARTCAYVCVGAQAYVCICVHEHSYMFASGHGDGGSSRDGARNLGWQNLLPIDIGDFHVACRRRS